MPSRFPKQASFQSITKHSYVLFLCFVPRLPEAFAELPCGAFRRTIFGEQKSLSDGQALLPRLSNDFLLPGASFPPQEHGENAEV